MSQADLTAMEEAQAMIERARSHTRRLQEYLTLPDLARLAEVAL
jgi:hypothetical protein